MPDGRLPARLPQARRHLCSVSAGQRTRPRRATGANPDLLAVASGPPVLPVCTAWCRRRRTPCSQDRELAPRSEALFNTGVHKRVADRKYVRRRAHGKALQCSEQCAPQPERRFEAQSSEVIDADGNTTQSGCEEPQETSLGCSREHYVGLHSTEKRDPLGQGPEIVKRRRLPPHRHGVTGGATCGSGFSNHHMHVPVRRQLLRKALHQTEALRMGNPQDNPHSRGHGSRRECHRFHPRRALSIRPKSPDVIAEPDGRISPFANSRSAVPFKVAVAPANTGCACIGFHIGRDSMASPERCTPRSTADQPAMAGSTISAVSQQLSSASSAPPKISTPGRSARGAIAFPPASALLHHAVEPHQLGAPDRGKEVGEAVVVADLGVLVVRDGLPRLG